MSNASTTDSSRVVQVAAGVDRTGTQTPVRDARHHALEILIGKWINQGQTTATPDISSVAIVTSDVYEFAPGGFFVVHTAFGKIGETSVGGVEIIGVDGDAYRSTFYDSFGNVHSSRMEIDGNTIRWLAEHTRCTATITDDGMTQVAHHEASADGANWISSMDVTLRKADLQPAAFHLG
jgi:hypothetical protein